jgi:hypothetical protein
MKFTPTEETKSAHQNPIKYRNTKQNTQWGSDQNPLSVSLSLSYPSTLISHKDPSSISEVEEGEDNV